MPYLLDSAPRRQNNVIIRPHHPPAVVLVQLDDVKQDQLERVRPAAFLILQTSPGNHQAWVAVEGGDREFASRLKKGTEADLPPAVRCALPELSITSASTLRISPW